MNDFRMQKLREAGALATTAGSNFVQLVIY